MPLDKVVVDHIDEMDAIENSIESEIDDVINKIDIDELINDPESTLEEVINITSNMLVEKYFKDSAQNGIDFARAVTKDGNVEIVKSADSQANEEQFEESFNEGKKD